MRKPLVALMAIIVVLSIALTACKSESGQNIVSEALGIDVSSSNEVSNYDAVALTVQSYSKDSLPMQAITWPCRQRSSTLSALPSIQYNSVASI